MDAHLMWGIIFAIYPGIPMFLVCRWLWRKGAKR